jgi:hypothetical protein
MRAVEFESGAEVVEFVLRPSGARRRHDDSGDQRETKQPATRRSHTQPSNPTRRPTWLAARSIRN